mmetsp:Transcript_66598/g.214611  ORF Transcript_66598/g.214611 Transcript_66598/m.214611 type:complete len:537 (-) Transcript_66598:146-1756(-)
MEDVELILGLAGTRSLLSCLQPYLEEASREPRLQRRLRIVRHGFSLFDAAEKEARLRQVLSEGGTYDVLDEASHNMSIVGERGYEREFYEAVERLRIAGWQVQTVCQTSMAGKVPVTYATGITLRDANGDGKATLLQSTSDKGRSHFGPTPGVLALAKLVGGEAELVGLLESSPHHGTFMHDLKAYFVACECDALLERGLLVPCSQVVFSEGSGVAPEERTPDVAFMGDVVASEGSEDVAAAVAAAVAAIHERHASVFGPSLRRKHAFLAAGELFVAAEKTAEYSQAFDEWLVEVWAEVARERGGQGCNPEPHAAHALRLPVAALVTDPGPGYIHRDPQKTPNAFVAQDIDDVLALVVVKPPPAGSRPLIVHISDETALFTRTFAAVVVLMPFVSRPQPQVCISVSRPTAAVETYFSAVHGPFLQLSLAVASALLQDPGLATVGALPPMLALQWPAATSSTLARSAAAAVRPLHMAAMRCARLGPRVSTEQLNKVLQEEVLTAPELMAMARASRLVPTCWAWGSQCLGCWPCGEVA